MPSIADHLAEPDINIGQHARRSQIALGQALAAKHAIYLDTNFWILLRNASKNTGNSKDKVLLDLLRTAVTNGVLFCPISQSIFVELVKQSDKSSRLATAGLIDELSSGVALLEEEMRLSTEIAYFLHANSGHTNLHPLEHLVWCKLSYVLGVLHPTNTVFDIRTERAIQKAFFDHMWTIPLCQFLATIGESPTPPPDLTDIVGTLNSGISMHSTELKTFKQSYAAEVRGIVDLVGGVAIDIVESMARDRGVILAQPSSKERRTSENAFKNLLAAALEHNKSRETLRTMHVLASLHASLRWNKGQKFKSNDLFDFHHAAAALAYCDAFLTDGPLRTMITQEHLALDKLYGCTVVADVDEAIALVRGLN